jgi:hypothetical protein
LEFCGFWNWDLVLSHISNQRESSISGMNPHEIFAQDVLFEELKTLLLSWCGRAYVLQITVVEGR